MSKGLSLHIGLNSVDPEHYRGWSGVLNACEADAQAMQEIAESQGYKSSILLTSSATRQRVSDEMRAAAAGLAEGDIFFLTYSGHGGQLPDLSGDEPDRMDETWCLFDGELVDDEVYNLLAQLAAGVRVLVLSDSCHSGTVIKLAYYYPQPTSATKDRPAYKAMPESVALRVYQANKAFYDRILTDPALKDSEERVKASALLISGCQDNQYSQDGVFNGLFTGALLRVWGGGRFKGDYPGLHSAIVARMPPDQTPNYYTVGSPNPGFEKQRPFSI